MKLVHNQENIKSEYDEFNFNLMDDLRASEEKFYHIFDFNPCPMSVNDVVTGRIIDVNQSFLDIMGFQSKINVIGRSMDESDFKLLGTKNRNVFLKKILEDGMVKNIPIPFRNLSGKKHKGLFSGTLVELNGKKCLLIVCQVINKQCIMNSLFLF